MAILRTIQCDICGDIFTEAKYNEGFPEWGKLLGKMDKITGNTEFCLCPKHLNKVFEFVTPLILGGGEDSNVD